jgi:acyl-CoA dehydrogenase family member 9
MSDENKNEIPSIAKTLFFGQINENDVLPYPALTQEQKEFAKEMTQAVDKFAQDNIDAAKFDRDHEVPDEVMQGLAELGLCGLGVDEELGGLGLDLTLYSRVFSEVCANDASIATMLGAHQSIGYKALVNEGTKEQKEKWLPRLASGEIYAAFALTEPGSGSDAYSIKTKAIKNDDDTFTINGQKLWITNGGKAHFYSVFCKTDHEIDGKKVEKITCFIVEKTMEGVSFGEKEDKMGICASETRAVYFDNVKVPASNMIGQPGKGFKIAMNVLNSGRLSLGAGAIGGMKTMLKLATEQAKTRKQFGDYICNFGMIQIKLAEMAANIYAAESIVYMTTGKAIQGMNDYSVESAICKVFCSEMLWDSVDRATQIAAGNGYMREYPYERMLRDSRINLIFEGTNEILRIFIALSGIRGPSEDLKEIGKLSTDPSTFLSKPIKSLGLLSSFGLKRMGLISTVTLSNVHPELEEYANAFSSRLSSFSSKVQDIIIKHGKSIIGSELPQNRLANMVIELYVSLCVISRTDYILNNKDVTEKDKKYVNSMAQLIMKRSIKAFDENYERAGSSYDKLLPEISKGVVERSGFGFDIIDF